MNPYKEARLKAGFSAYEAAHQIGVKHNTLYMWETGRNKPNAENLIKIARVYGCRPEELVAH